MPRVNFRLFACLAVLLIGYSAARTRGDDAKPAEPKNLALNQTATASSEESDEHSAAKAVDGDDNTRWCASGPEVPAWLQIDLGKPADLTGAEIRWEMDGKKYQYVVEGSPDAKTWTALSDQTNNTSTSQVQPLKFDGKGVRYVRIRVTGLEDGSWASIFEVKVFGSN
jgi:hypothetical protein